MAAGRCIDEAAAARSPQTALLLAGGKTAVSAVLPVVFFPNASRLMVFIEKKWTRSSGGGGETAPLSIS